MFIIANFLFFFTLSFTCNFLAVKVLKNNFKKLQVVITSLFIPASILISFFSRSLDSLFDKFFGGNFVDFGFDFSFFSGTSAVLLYPLIYLVIGISFILIFGGVILKTLNVIGNKGTTKSKYTEAKTVFIELTIGLVFLILLSNILTLLGVIK